MAEKKTEIQVFDGGVTEEQVHGTTQHCADRSSRQPKKRITSHLLRGDMPEEKEDKDGVIKACALIRSNLHIDPTAGSGNDFVGWYAEALWLEEMRMKNHAEILSRVLLALFGQRQSL